MIIRYLYDRRRRPYGVVVALDEQHIGSAVCHSRKDTFTKSEGRLRATRRAFLNEHAKIGGKRGQQLARAIEYVRHLAQKYPHLSEARALEEVDTYCARIDLDARPRRVAAYTAAIILQQQLTERVSFDWTEFDTAADFMMLTAEERLEHLSSSLHLSHDCTCGHCAAPEGGDGEATRTLPELLA